MNKGSNAAAIKKYNQSLIIEIIKNKKEISRVELSKITGISKGGMTPLVQELLNLEILMEAGTTSTYAGRKPVLLQLNKDACYAVVVDFTRKKFSVGLVNFIGEIIYEYEYSYYNSEKDLDSIIRRIENIIESIIEKAKSDNKNVIGISMVAPGPQDYKNGIILNPPQFYNWNNIEIKKIFREKFGLPVYLDNNANSYAISEKYYGKGKDYSNFICLIVDEGIGTGIVINNKLYRGTNGFGSEFGHTTIDFNGPRCECGNRGCIELYCSIPALMKWANKEIGCGERNFKWTDVAKEYIKGDEVSKKIFDREIELLGNALVNISNVFAPQAIILCSLITKGGEPFLKSIKDYLAEHVAARKFNLPEIHISDVSQATLKGGAALIFEKFIQGELGTFVELMNTK